MPQDVLLKGQFDNNGDLWVYRDHNLYRLSAGKFALISSRCDSRSDIKQTLIKEGFIKPDPLQKALDAVDRIQDYNLLPSELADRTKQIIRTLAEELTDD